MEAQDKLNELKQKLKDDQAKIFGLLFSEDTRIVDSNTITSLVFNMRGINRTLKFLDTDEEPKEKREDYIG